MYKDNPKYELLFTHGIYNVYFLKDENIQELHKSREVEATVQNEYSRAGATATYIEGLCAKALKMLEEDPKGELLRTNMVALWNQLMYRTKYPVDSLCGIRMGAILSYLEFTGSDGTLQSEPQDAQIAWINKKVQIAMENPAAYTFFLRWGIGNTPSYWEHSSSLNELNYFELRSEMINTLSQLPKG